MSTRSLTPKEKEFNQYLQRQDLPSFAAKDFDQEEVQYLLQQYLDQDEGLYLSVSMHLMNDIEPLGEDIYQATASLFDISHRPLIKKIAHEDYFYTYSLGFVPIRDEGLNSIRHTQDTTINKELAEWKSTCIALDKSKQYIKNTYPRWEKMNAYEKKEALATIKAQASNLDVFQCNPLEPLTTFLSKYHSLNKMSTYKAELLLELNLPNISKLEIAKKIVKEMLILKSD